MIRRARISATPYISGADAGNCGRCFIIVFSFLVGIVNFSLSWPREHAQIGGGAALRKNNSRIATAAVVNLPSS